jgi:uncharacterized protein HemY
MRPGVSDSRTLEKHLTTVVVVLVLVLVVLLGVLAYFVFFH